MKFHSFTIGLFFFVLALVLFFLGALPIVVQPYEAWRVRFISAGLFCWALSGAWN